MREDKGTHCLIKKYDGIPVLASFESLVQVSLNLRSLRTNVAGSERK